MNYTFSDYFTPNYFTSTDIANILFALFLGSAVIVCVWLWIARPKATSSASSAPKEADTTTPVMSVVNRFPQFKASELAWLKKEQIEALAKQLDVNVFGLHRMKAIKVLCESGLSEQHLERVS